MNEPSEFCCPFCNQWNPIVVWKQHIETHKLGNNIHVPGFASYIVPPESYEKMKERFSPLGMFEEK